MGMLGNLVDPTDFIREEEILRFRGTTETFGRNATDLEALGRQFFGSRSSTRELAKSIGVFELREFESKENLEEYLTQPGLGRE